MSQIIIDYIKIISLQQCDSLHISLLFSFRLCYTLGVESFKAVAISIKVGDAYEHLFKNLSKGGCVLSVYEALTLVCSFATLLVALVSLIVKLIDIKTKK